MTLTAKFSGDICDALLYRVRSEGGVACSETLVRTILSLCQNTINAFLKRITTITTFTLTPKKPVYDLDAEFADCHEVVSIRDEEKLVEDCKGLDGLFHLDTCWLRHPDSGPEVWAQIGHHFLAVYPQPKEARVVNIVYVKDLQPLVDDNTALELLEEDLTMCLDIAELILLTMSARGNKLEEAVAKLKEFMLRYGLVEASFQDRSSPVVGEG